MKRSEELTKNSTEGRSDGRSPGTGWLIIARALALKTQALHLRPPLLLTTRAERTRSRISCSATARHMTTTGHADHRTCDDLIDAAPKKLAQRDAATASRSIHVDDRTVAADLPAPDGPVA
jgi:hypothetical protein